MPPWTMKAAAQRVVALMPFSHAVNELMQTHLSRSLHLSRKMFESRLAACNTHIAHLRQAADDQALQNRDVVEIGTGWFPVVPIALWLSGVRSVHTLDIGRHVNAQRLEQTIRGFVEAEQRGELAALLPDLRPERLAQLKIVAAQGDFRDPVAILRDWGIQYRVETLQAAGLPDQSIDLILSYSVLQYFPRRDLDSMLREFRRIVREPGIISHWIDLADEYAYFDTSITAYNFLRFSDNAWKLISSSLLPLSRLRLPDYRAALVQAGFRTLVEEVENGDAADLARVPLAPRFKAVPAHDLLPLYAWIAAAPAPRQTH